MVCPHLLGVYSSTAIHLDKADTTGKFLPRPVNPRNRSNIRHLIPGNPSRVDKFEQVTQADHPPRHLPISLLEIIFRSAHGECDPRVVVRERKRCGCRCRDDA